MSYSFCKSPDAYKSSSDNLCSAASYHFFKKIMAFTLEIWEKVVPLHSQNRNKGSLAQLNRAFDYGSKGYRFESYRSHSSVFEAERFQIKKSKEIYVVFTVHHRAPPLSKTGNNISISTLQILLKVVTFAQASK